MATIADAKIDGIFGAIEPGQMFQFVGRTARDGGDDKGVYMALSPFGNLVKLNEFTQRAAVALDTGGVFVGASDLPVRRVYEATLRDDGRSRL